MRLLKVLSTVLFAAIALFAGLLTALLVALGGALIYFLGRLFGASKPARAAGGSFRRPAPAGRVDGDVIDVTATEVPADPSTR